MTEGPPIALVELDHVGVERSLRQKLDIAELLRLLVEDVDKGSADPLALFLGVGDPGEPLQEQIAGVAMDQRDVVMPAEQVDDLLGFAGAQQAGVDKDAGQLVADSLVQQCRRDRGIDPARQAADDIAVADPFADAVERIGAEQGHGPVAAATRDLVGKVAQQFRTLRGMRHLGMKQKAIKPPLVIGDRGKGGRFARRYRAEAGRHHVDLVAVAHPHLGAVALGPQPVEQEAVVENVDKGAAELLMLAQRDPAAQFVAHRLHAVADAQHRDPKAEGDRRRPRCRTFGHRGRAAREDDRPRVEVAHLAVADRIGVDFAIHPALAHAARDQLGNLAAEIDDQDAVGHQVWSSKLSRADPTGRRSNRATKKPSVPWRAGVRNR